MSCHGPFNEASVTADRNKRRALGGTGHSLKTGGCHEAYPHTRRRHRTCGCTPGGIDIDDVSPRTSGRTVSVESASDRRSRGFPSSLSPFPSETLSYRSKTLAL
jgi:hypothetical protein